jgi:hypothetical protein
MKLVDVAIEGDLFVIIVKHEGGDKEKWLYEREENGGCVSYSMIGREDTK